MRKIKALWETLYIRLLYVLACMPFVAGYLAQVSTQIIYIVLGTPTGTKLRKSKEINH